MDYWAHSLQSAAKSGWQPLKEHLLSVAERAKRFAGLFGAGDVAWLTGMCHDLGKYSEEFQKRLEDPRVHVDHATAGATVAAAKYGPFGRLMAYAIAGHHGGIPDGGDENDEDSLAYRLAFKRLCDFSAYATEIELPPRPPGLPVSWQAERLGFSAAFFVRMLFSCIVDADFLDTEQFLEPSKSRRRGGAEPLSILEERMSEHLRKKMGDATPSYVNRKRAEVLAACLDAAEQAPGLFSLTVPTGGGKTLSSLAFALKHARLHGLERVIYVIPFTSIIDQNAKVFRDAVGAGAVLEHHSNVIRPRENRDEDFASRLELAEENWDMPVVVTTNVQFFESLFSNRPSRCRKLHNIARSVVILDEAQMLPLELLEPCVAALHEVVSNYGTTVVLCSATQPALDRLFPEGVRPREIARDPAALYTALKRVDVRNLHTLGNDEITANLMAQEQALCIVNTRAHARQVFERLGKADGHYHLSAAMCPVHRAARLKEIRARLASVKGGKVCRVVSTQLIEAGVDVDFPVVMRAIAGIDSIAQAAGRCNREGLQERGRVLVFTPEGGEGMSHVWFRRTASIAMTILERRQDPLDLDSVQVYFQDLYLYEGKRLGQSNQPSRLDAHGIMQKIEIESGRLSFPFREVADLFKVIGDDTVGVVIPYDCQCKALLEEIGAQGISRDAGRRLQAYSVSVRPWEYRQLQEAGALEEVGGLEVLRDMSLYDDNYGLVFTVIKEKGGDNWIV
jgi:CRISPR-associated helicase Cas3/CRISPR-associated endonuclease Cas3-HD